MGSNGSFVEKSTIMGLISRRALSGKQIGAI